MRISLAEAEGQWADLVSRVEAGDEIILTRNGAPAAKLVAIEPEDNYVPTTREERRAALEEARKAGRAADQRALDAAAKSGVPMQPEPTAARSQDFLYGDDGMPG
jgi:prevent-host-death family protein